MAPAFDLDYKIDIDQRLQFIEEVRSIHTAFETEEYTQHLLRGVYTQHLLRGVYTQHLLRGVYTQHLLRGVYTQHLLRGVYTQHKKVCNIFVRKLTRVLQNHLEKGNLSKQ